MPYVFIYNANKVFLQCIGATFIGNGFTCKNLTIIQTDMGIKVYDNIHLNNMAVNGSVYFINTSKIKLLDNYYSDCVRSNVSCFYNSCGCNDNKFEKILCYFYFYKTI